MSKSEKVQIILGYNTIIKRLINYYHDKSPDKNSSYAHVRRAKVFLDADPKSALEITGVKLFKYKDIIMLEKPERIKSSADAEKKEVLNEYTEQQDIASQLIDNVLNIWSDMAERDRDDFSNQLIELLQLYIRYILLEKKDRGK